MIRALSFAATVCALAGLFGGAMIFPRIAAKAHHEIQMTRELQGENHD